jgi:DNA polymerase III alpha subunit
VNGDTTVTYARPGPTPWLSASLWRRASPSSQAITAVLTTRDVADRCVVELPSLPMVRFPLPPATQRKELWRDWLKIGWQQRGCRRCYSRERANTPTACVTRCKIIEDKDFVDYFLVVADAIQFAKEHDIGVGPARGSSAGSLACWLLRITEVNPMLYPDDLIFERFIDVTRKTCPTSTSTSTASAERGYDYLVASTARVRRQRRHLHQVQGQEQP